MILLYFFSSFFFKLGFCFYCSKHLLPFDGHFFADNAAFDVDIATWACNGGEQVFAEEQQERGYLLVDEEDIIDGNV